MGRLRETLQPLSRHEPLIRGFVRHLFLPDEPQRYYSCLYDFDGILSEKSRQIDTFNAEFLLEGPWRISAGTGFDYLSGTITTIPNLRQLWQLYILGSLYKQELEQAVVELLNCPGESHTINKDNLRLIEMHKKISNRTLVAGREFFNQISPTVTEAAYLL